MNKYLSTIVTLAITLLSNTIYAESNGPLPTKAESPKQKIEYKRAIESLNDKHHGIPDALENACGIRLKVDFDYVLVEIAMRDNTGGYMKCGSAMSGIEYLCKNEAMYKDIIKKNIKSLYCKLDPKPDGFSVSLKGNALTVSYGEKFNETGIKSGVAEYIQNYKGFK